MSAKITLEIIKYQPEDNDNTFFIKTDDKTLDTSINYNQREPVKFDLTNLRKDAKFFIRLQKHGITQGSADFTITQLSFVKRDELISKTLNVISFLKKEVVGKLLIKVRLTYPDMNASSNINNLKEVTRSSSALPLENRSATTRGSLITMNNGSTNKSISSYISYFNANGSANGSLTNFQTLKKNSTTTKNSIKNNIYSSPNTKRFSTEKKRASVIERNKLKDEVDNSRIETLFDDDKISGIENVGKNLQQFIVEFRSRYKEKFEENPEDKTQEGFQKIIEQMFDLQEIYYEDFKKATSLNSILKSYLLSYSENFRNFNKKSNRLNEILETLAVKKEFSDTLNRQDNQRILDSIDIHRKELKIYKNIFKVKYDQDLFEKYKKEMKSEKYENYKSSLLKSIEEIASNPKKWEKLDVKKKDDFFNIARKFNVKVKTTEDIQEEEREKERLKQEELEREKEKERLRELEKEKLANASKGLRIEITQNQSNGEKAGNTISIITNNNNSTESNEKKEKIVKSQRKRLTIVESDNADQNDAKLDQSLINIYNKKRMSFIPVKRVSEETYEFGSQKIQIKIDGDVIRVKSGKGYILLDQYIDIYGPIEENLMIQSHMPQDSKNGISINNNGIGINISASPSALKKK